MIIYVLLLPSRRQLHFSFLSLMMTTIVSIQEIKSLIIKAAAINVPIELIFYDTNPSCLLIFFYFWYIIIAFLIINLRYNLLRTILGIIRFNKLLLKIHFNF